MIGYLTGKIISKKPTQVLLDVNGVGYIINISINTFDKLSEEKEIASLYTYLNVKEDSLDLYGFDTPPEKEMFEMLISVNGVGPKSALSFLSGIQLDELKEAIKTGNLGRIIAVPGIGKKTGERLLIELRDKVDSIAEAVSSDSSLPNFNVRSDAVAALVSLGYNAKQAEKAAKIVMDSNPSVSIEELIKLSLAMLNK
ncbi:MAG: Holliday junction branch migration protein RuvA [Rhodothermaceae bacterium]